ncbi:MAG: carboxypeptidase regulatory-like domain-containing protein [Cyanobacteria bacterium NC_groundwater_1444_Ag_S-0.65um_54_12]|nr:carboxypeptidase regulatory-like domain-containing protein [Cyanobacteria bacterium NC_groundwater_1444_Ag_S-0.65um_54_12]
MWHSLTVILHARWLRRKPWLILLSSIMAVASCRQGIWPVFGPSGLTSAPVILSITHSAPLVVGTVLDRWGRPAPGVKVRIYEGYHLPLDGVTQTTPLDGVTQTTPLDGVTQTTPLDGVTQTTPLQVTGKTGSDGHFALRAPERTLLSLEASDDQGDKAARLDLRLTKHIAQVDVGKLRLDLPGTIVGRVKIPQGNALASTAVFIPGTDQVVRTDAAGNYRLVKVAAGTVRLAAMRSRFRTAVLSDIAVRAGQVITAPDLVLHPEQPALTSLVPDSAGPGATIRLLGKDLGYREQSPIAVYFGRLKASDFVRLSDTEIAVTVPPGAASGPVRVLSDGVTSNQLPFTAMASLSLLPATSRLHLTEPLSLQVQAWDDAGRLIASPSFTWTLDPPDWATWDSSYRLKALRPGFGRVQAASGALRATTLVGFGNWRMTSVLGPNDPTADALEGPASAVRLRYPQDLAVAPDGSLLFTDLASNDAISDMPVILPVRRLAANGMVTVVAGTGSSGYDGDGLPAQSSRLGTVRYIAVLPSGAILLADRGNHRVRLVAEREVTFLGRMLAAGMLWDVVGNGYSDPGNWWREGQAIATPRALGLAWLEAMAWDPATEQLLLVDRQVNSGQRLWQIGPDDTATLLLKTDGAVTADPALTNQDPDNFHGKINALATDAKGNIYLGTLDRVWLLCRHSGWFFGVAASAGQIVTLAGSGKLSFDHEEGPALQVALWNIADLAFWQGHLLVVDKANYRLRDLSPDGTLRTIAGGGTGLSNLALAASLGFVSSIVSSQDGIYLADHSNHRILALRADP